MLEEGQKAPAFELVDEENRLRKLKDFQGHPLVLYFYPRADTPGCTIEANEFRDALQGFKKLGVAVVGVSSDTPAAQKKFKDKFGLNFPLLCDVDKKVVKAYDVLKEKNMYGKKVMGIERTTFLIDASGKIARIFRKVKAEGHAEQVMEALKG